MTPETPTERTAVVMARLVRGDTLTPGEIQSMTGLSRTGSYIIMYRISRVQPLVLYEGRWLLLEYVNGVDTATG